MPRRETAARRYAEAAFQVASADGALNRWQSDLGVIGEALAVPELAAVMEHPAIPYADKERVLRRSAPDVATGPMNLVLLMIRRGRPGAIPAMRRHFEELVLRQRGIVRAEVRTALPLGDEDRADLERSLGPIRVAPVPIPHDCADGFIGAFWRRPEAYLDPVVRGAISHFMLLDPLIVRRGVARLAADLESGRWESRHGNLRARESLDLGYRLVVAEFG